MTDTTTDLHVHSVTGRYVLGNQARIPGVNIFACRLKTISPRRLVATAPVPGKVGDAICITTAPFGTLKGHIVRHVSDGFAVNLDPAEPDNAGLAERIEAFRTRLWTGMADRRAEKRFLPGEPRSALQMSDGRRLPCLVVDYSASGAAVSADIAPGIGAQVTIGEVTGSVVRLFDMGFAVQFDALQNPDEIESLLEAPEAWDALIGRRRRRSRIDKGEEDPALAGASY